MARFVLKYKYEKKPNRDRADVTLERSRITMGSRPLADIYVADRLLPQEACEFAFNGATLQIDVKTPLAGVFVNGTPVEGVGPVPNGASVQIGHTLVEVSINDATQTCQLTVGERYLTKTVEGLSAKAPEKFALESDGPQEHRWGKSPVLVRWNWIAVLLGVLALAAFPVIADTEITNRGALHRNHAIGGGSEQPTGCADCHSAFSSDYGAACGKCHFDKGPGGEKILLDDQRHHPYAQAADFSCQHCHPEHRGPDGDLLPPADIVEGGWMRTCESCHAGQNHEQKTAEALANPDVAKRVRDRPSDAVERWLLVDGFSHKDHRIPKTGRLSLAPGKVPEATDVPLACSKCHEQIKGDQQGASKDSEFALVPYEKCLDCHADWRVDVHGRDSGGLHCFQCHQKTDDVHAIKKDIRTVEVAETGSLYELAPRRHDYAKDECTKCHVNGKQGVAPQKTQRLAFRHDHHLPAIDMGRGGDIVLQKLCADCHKGVEKSTTLTGLGESLPVAELTGCTACHDTAPKPVPGTGRRKIVDMFHSVHTVEHEAAGAALRRPAGKDSLSGGCLACHQVVAGSAKMALKKGTEDCTACHAGHDALGGGKCAICHVDRASEKNVDKTTGALIGYNTSEAGIFNRERAVKKTSHPVQRFNHFSRGHKPDAGAKGDGCEDCHDAKSIDATDRVLDIPWPGHADPSCVECHVKERYHR